MSEKTNAPDSDRSARNYHPDAADDPIPEADTTIEELQTSNKSGKHSTAEKLAASRPDYGTGRRAEHVDGAFGNQEEDEKAKKPLLGTS